MKRFTLLALLMLPLTAIADGGLLFKNAHVAAAPPGVKTMAAYMSIENSGKKSRQIVAVSSKDFSSVQIHRSVVEDGVARMLPQETITIDPQTTVSLQPGGVHLMLIEPGHEVLEGELVILEFREADGTEHKLALKVRKSDPHEHHH